MWETVRLGKIASFVRGLTYSKKDEVETDGIPVLRATNIDLKRHKIVLDDIRLIRRSLKVSPEKFLRKGDLLICTASGSKSHLGKVALIEEDVEFAFGGFMAAIRLNKYCDSRFIYYLLTSREFKRHLDKVSDGTNINNLKFSQIEDFEINLPPLAEQKRIVERLDKAFAEIDKAIATAEAKEGEIERLVQQSINTTINRPCSRVLEKTLEQIADFLDYRGRTPEKSDDGIKLLTAKNVRMGFIKNSPEEFVSEKVYRLRMTRGFPKIGDVVFTTEAPLGLIAQIEDESVALGQRLIVFQPRGECIKSDFLKYSLMSTSNQEKIQSAGTGATVKGIKASLLKKIVISFPESVEEQTSRVTKVKKIEEATNSLREATHRKIYDLTALKASILKEELTPSEAV